MGHILVFENFNIQTSDNEIIEFEITTDLLELVNLSSLEPEYFIYDYDYDDDYDDDGDDDGENIHEKAVDNFSNDLYYNEILALSKNWFSQEVSTILIDSLPFITRIEPNKIIEPSGYHNPNYELSLSIEVNVFQMSNEVMEYFSNQKFKQHLKDNYSSRSGFMSFMPNKIEDIIEILESSEYKDYWKIFVIIFSYLKEYNEFEYESLESYIEYNLTERSIYDFQK